MRSRCQPENALPKIPMWEPFDRRRYSSCLTPVIRGRGRECANIARPPGKFTRLAKEGGSNDDAGSRVLLKPRDELSQKRGRDARMPFMTVDRILVVCTANMIRSPFVAGLLSSRLPQARSGRLTVHSAGTAARPGHAVPEDVLTIGRTYGLSLETHRSRRLDEGLLRAGDTVLCAEAAHRRVVLDLRPDLIASTFTVREFARLTEAPSVRGSAGSWAELVRACAGARLASAGTNAENDDIVDPVDGPASAWFAFERQATGAVSAILGAVGSLRPADPSASAVDPAPRTRREYRQAQLTPSDPPAPWKK